MLKIGLALVLLVYIIEAIVCFVIIKLLNGIYNDFDPETKTMQVATKRTIHVLKMVGIIYFVPLVGLAIILVFYPRVTVFIVLLILLSTFFVTNKIIIPASKRKHIEIEEEMYGENSDYALLLREVYGIPKRRTVFAIVVEKQDNKPPIITFLQKKEKYDVTDRMQ